MELLDGRGIGAQIGDKDLNASWSNEIKKRNFRVLCKPGLLDGYNSGRTKNTNAG